MITNNGVESSENVGKEESPIAPSPSITLPKGGGAIRGIGEKFSVNPATGTGSLTVPIFTSPGRSDFYPKLSLSYNSGSGNGPFGIGWKLSTPSITRKTDKGLPRYEDDWESEAYILSDAEDLTPALTYQPTSGQWLPTVSSNTMPDGETYNVKRYRPRVEGLFARIEQWQRQSDGDIHWVTVTKDNVTSVYGQSVAARVADPENPSHVFQWLLETTFDDKGSVIAYEYVAENTWGINPAAACEQNRLNGNSPFTYTYLKRILYGNPTPYTAGQDLEGTAWLFEVVFDYGEHNLTLPEPTPDPNEHWFTRADPFSSFRSGFEVRCYRLCQRVLMFHHFPSFATSGSDTGPAANPKIYVPATNPGYDGVVRVTQFVYDQTAASSPLMGNPVATQLASITQIGYAWKVVGASYAQKAFPPVTFTYSEAGLDPTVRVVPPENVANAPAGLAAPTFQWIDLDGEGSAGILCEESGALFYQRNSSAGHTRFENGVERAFARFDATELVAHEPGFANAGVKTQFMDLAGDGRQDMVQMLGMARGFYAHGKDKGWEGFRPFEKFPNLDINDPNLKFIDIDGDGLTDILISEDEVMSWHLSEGDRGFGCRYYARKPIGEEKGPALVFADPTQSIFLADMNGDGLTDIVRIRSGEVCYWPNRGYGRFGAKVLMDNTPAFDPPDLFDPRRIRLADIDGSGTTDIAYLRDCEVTIHLNQSGNGWAAPQRLGGVPPIDDVAAISVFDLLGNGTACLVWSLPLPTFAGRQMQYIDLMGGQKPYLLTGVSNNMGAETRVRYASSAKFYVRDREAGIPWVTKLAFPVQVVERTEIFDYLNRSKLVSSYKYRHGYFDGVEREFRGFGYVEQRDAESFADDPSASLFTESTDVEADALSLPPVVTKTWYHTGAWPDENTVLHHMAHEYFGAPAPGDPQFAQDWETFLTGLLPDALLPARVTAADGSQQDYSLTGQDMRQAIRALKGTILRQEIYAEDGTSKASLPYSVSERTYAVKCFQPKDGNRYGVYYTHSRETVDYHYERNPKDGRVTHEVTLKVDGFGNVLQSVSAAYGRNLAGANLAPPTAPSGAPNPSVDPSLAAQLEQVMPLFKLTENTFTAAIDAAAYRGPMPAETCVYQLTLKSRNDESVRYSFEQFAGFVATAVAIAFDALPSYAQPEKRLISHTRTYYYINNLQGPEPLGTTDTLGLVYKTFKLAFTAPLAADIYLVAAMPNLPTATALTGILSGDGGYVHSEGDSDWWIPSAQTIYSPVPAGAAAATFAQDASAAALGFYLPQALCDPFGNFTRLTYDQFDLLLTETEDALSNIVTAQNDYRVLQPNLVIDPNENQTAAYYDLLGMLARTAVMGKMPSANAPESGDSLAGLTSDLSQGAIDAFIGAPDPSAEAPGLLGSATKLFIYDLQCFANSYSANPNNASSWASNYSATIVRETHVNLSGGQASKVQLSFSYSDGLGREIQKKIQAEPDAAGNPRWIGSGWTIFNNKGKPVRQYEPFYTATCQFELVYTVGVTPTLFYDPLVRLIATLRPDHSWEKAVFCPWRQENWDGNDTVSIVDPSQDADVGAYFKRLPSADYMPTWLAQKSAGSAADQDAASKTQIHANTPNVTVFDPLGRAFLSVAHNRYLLNGAPSDEFYSTRSALDIQGNLISVTDPLGRLAITYAYNLPGDRADQSSMEAGQRWFLSNVVGKPIRLWDSRFFARTMTYDALQRLTGLYVASNGAAAILAEQTIYGEAQGPAQNFLGRVYQVNDAAGTVVNSGYDFQGNLLGSVRQFLSDPTTPPDWSATSSPALGPDTFKTATTYDALNRPVSMTTPDQSVVTPAYNKTNLLQQLSVNLLGAGTVTLFVSNITYDPKNQRLSIDYGNGASTAYGYDPETFRLINLMTTRPSGANGVSALFSQATMVQDLTYTYDPVGNITNIADGAVATIYNNNQMLPAALNYAYDAIYRLIQASGREQIAQAALLPDPQYGNQRDYPFAGYNVGFNDIQALQGYIERYTYNPAGSITQMTHAANAGGWNRLYNYNEPSLLESANVSNRLSSTQVGSNTLGAIQYNQHGDATRMPHLYDMEWDFKDQLSSTQQQVVNAANTTGNRTYYAYDSTGQRVRKATVANGNVLNERFYIGRYEVYRAYGACGDSQLQTLHVMDDKQRVALVETSSTDTSDAIVPAPASAPVTTTRYQIGNQLGSVAVELDDEANLLTYEEYTPFGNPSFQTGSSAAEVGLKRYRYTAKERDEESGLYYHGARYYAPWLGAWLSCDPIGVKDTTNLYTYGRNNPIGFKDSTGLEPDPSAAVCVDPTVPTPDEEAIRYNIPSQHTLENTPSEKSPESEISEGLTSEKESQESAFNKEKAEEYTSISEKLHLSMEGAGALEPYVEGMGEGFSELYWHVHLAISSYDFPIQSAWKWTFVEPEFSPTVAAVESFASKAGGFLKLAEDYAPVVQFIGGRMNLQQASLEKRSGDSLSAALDTASGYTKMSMAVGVGFKLVSAGAGFVIGLGIPLGFDSLKAAYQGTEQPIDAIDRVMKSTLGFNLSLGDLSAYPEANAKLRQEEEATFGKAEAAKLRMLDSLKL